MVAMSIFFIGIIASKARFVGATRVSFVPTNSIARAGVLSQRVLPRAQLAMVKQGWSCRNEVACQVAGRLSITRRVPAENRRSDESASLSVK
jgi:hypothetical protein